MFLIETLLSLWTGLPYDMKVWFNTGSWMSQGINIYLPNDHLGYPPLWAFWCLVAYRIYAFLGNSLEIWRYAIKLPMILGQLALAYVVGRFAESRFDKKTAQRIFFFTLTWNFFIYIGALWGQINVLSALLTFLAFYAVVSQRNGAGAVLLGIAATLKIYPLVALPAFFAYVLKKRNAQEASKFLFYTCIIPVLFTVFVFAFFQWDITFFLRTVLYSTPVFENNPVQITSGGMNIWSFVALFNFDIAGFWLLRLLWIPLMAAGAFYWLRKPQLNETDLNLSLISLYILFMISYAWVTEQFFLDPLPFIFLQILAYRPKQSHLYIFVGIQSLVYAFSAVNGGGWIFLPLAEKFFSPFIAPINFDFTLNPLIWTIRGDIGLVISLSLGGFLIILMKPSILTQATNALHRKIGSIIKTKKGKITNQTT